MMQVAPEHVGVGFASTALAGVIPTVIEVSSDANKEVQTIKYLNFEANRLTRELLVCVSLRAIRVLLA